MVEILAIEVFQDWRRRCFDAFTFAALVTVENGVELKPRGSEWILELSFI